MRKPDKKAFHAALRAIGLASHRMAYDPQSDEYHVTDRRGEVLARVPIRFARDPDGYIALMKAVVRAKRATA